MTVCRCGCAVAGVPPANRRRRRRSRGRVAPSRRSPHLQLLRPRVRLVRRSTRSRVSRRRWSTIDSPGQPAAACLTALRREPSDQLDSRSDAPRHAADQRVQGRPRVASTPARFTLIHRCGPVSNTRNSRPWCYCTAEVHQAVDAERHPGSPVITQLRCRRRANTACCDRLTKVRAGSCAGRIRRSARLPTGSS